jgi:transposase
VFVLGIDIAKRTFAAALRLPEAKLRHKTFRNTSAGFTELVAWLQRHGATQVHAGLEATGTYGEALAAFLADAGHIVSVINPAVIHAYARSQLARSKTDRLDAALIAHFTATQQPPAWTPPAREIRALHALVRRLDALQDMRTQEANRLQAGVPIVEVTASIEAVLASLDDQIAHVRRLIRDHVDQHPGLREQRDLLTSIPGIGDATAAILIAELFDKRYSNARQAAAFAGVVPRLVESGTLRGRSRLSKIGPGRLRKALYFPAVTALRCNPTIKVVSTRLLAAGKPKMVIIGAAMRKLIHLAYGVLKSRRAYEPTYAHP